MSCDYLCGNAYLNLDATTPANSETCDIGDWAFKKLDKNGWGNIATTPNPPGGFTNTAASISSWISTYSDPKVNSALALGCDTDCMAISLTTTDPVTGKVYTNTFKFDSTTYSHLGTDRCGDGIYDGDVVYTNTTTGQTITIRSSTYGYPTPQPASPNFSPRTSVITGYTPYWS